MTMLAASSAVHAKARAYLAAGRVRVMSVHDGVADVLVYGSSPNPYSVVWLSQRGDCVCQARVVCAHLLASALILPESVTGIEEHHG